jgi:hypothetical protein
MYNLKIHILCFIKDLFFCDIQFRPMIQIEPLEVSNCVRTDVPLRYQRRLGFSLLFRLDSSSINRLRRYLLLLYEGRFHGHFRVIVVNSPLARPFCRLAETLLLMTMTLLMICL